MAKRTPGTTSIDAQMVYEKLKIMKPGESISFQELSDLTGRDIKKHRHILVTARKKALKDSILFEKIFKVGIKRLTDSEIVDDVPVQTLRKTSSDLRNGMRKICCATNLNKQERDRQKAAICHFGIVSEFTKPDAIDKVIKLQKKSGSLIPYQNLIEMFENREDLL